MEQLLISKNDQIVSINVPGLGGKFWGPGGLQLT